MRVCTGRERPRPQNKGQECQCVIYVNVINGRAKQQTNCGGRHTGQIS